MLNQEEVSQIVGKPMPFVKHFPATGVAFEAYADAEEFLKEHGYSVGSMQRHEPIGVAKGDADISKWRNLGRDVKMLDGVLVSDSFRESGVTLYLSEEPK